MIQEAIYPPDAQTLVQRFAAGQKFPLDPFQLEAMEALSAGRSVLVSAPTGSGKTLVAEFAIFLALEAKARCIYTTPLKALSNQKFRDLSVEMGDQVGLVTGDVVMNPSAPILIMTTEILRNILQMDPDQVSDVSHVILDEAHYMGSEGRGTVWEETIVFLGKGTSIVALSATIPNSQELADWVSLVHKPMDVIYHATRPVPLMPYVALEKLEPLFDKRDKLRVRSVDNPGWLQPPLSSHVVRELHKAEMLPAIFFVFSRIGCEKEALEVIRTSPALTSPEEKRLIMEAVKEAIEKTPGMLTSKATKGWLDRIHYGVAPHHAGLLPPLKLLIEILFQRNLLKAVFATETLAAGINMPARTVIITSLSKRTDDGHRMLSVSEFAQMTGRAGRRGMDPVGYGVVMPSHRYSVHDVVGLFRGESEPLKSRFTLNYNMVINLIHRYDPKHAQRIVEQCFSQFQNNTAIADLTRQVSQAEAELNKRDARCPRYPDEFSRQELLSSYKRVKKNKEDQRAKLAALETSQRYLGKADALRALKAAPFHSFAIVQLPDERKPQLALILDKFPLKSGDAQFTVLLEDGILTRLATRHLILPLNAPVVGVPSELAKRAEKLSFLQKDQLKGPALPWGRWLEEAGINDREDVLPQDREPRQIQEAKEDVQAATKEWEAARCFNCNFYKRCIDENKAQQQVGKLVADLHSEISEIQGKYWRRFLTLQHVLETAGFLRDRELLPRGVALAHLRTANELLAGETLASGLLQRLGPSELCAAASCIVAEPIRGRMTWRPVKPSTAVYDAIDEMCDMAKGIDKNEHDCGLSPGEMPLYVTTVYAGLVQAWAEQAQWAHLTELAGIDEGQLVRHLRQVIDMLQQFKEVPGTDPGFKDKVSAAVALLDRDIVQEVF
jgi:superfamily II RNA helicase